MMLKSGNKIRIALSKGSLLTKTLEILDDCGYDISRIKTKSRQLYFFDGDIEFIVARAADVPTYVMYGAADLGFVGKDVLMEGAYDLFELLDLGYGRCKFVVAGPKDGSIDEDYRRLGRLRVATKFPGVASEYFEKEGIQVELIKLYGSLELAPLVGLSDIIVDLMSTGRTLAENNLKVIDEIETVSCRLIANYVSDKLKSNEIEDIISRIEKSISSNT